MLEYTLKNGIRLVAEKLPHLHSVCMGVWVNVGSGNEQPQENGLSHFIEHLVFKGTASRSARDIAEEMDDIGAQLNAFTSKNCTCYYVRALDKDLDKGLDILADIVYRPSFKEEDIDTERGVVLEEIAMCNDNMEDIIFNLSAKAVYEGSLSMPILGTHELISAYQREDILHYWKRHYSPGNIVLSLVGNFDEKELIQKVEELFGSCPNADIALQSFKNSLRLHNIAMDKDIEQSNIILSYPGFELGNTYDYALNIVNNILGGGMSSRIVQKVREELGLAYSVYSYVNSDKEVGTLSIYAGTNPKTARLVVDELRREVEKIREEGIREKEFLASKAQLLSSLEFGLESTSSRMSRLGRGMLFLNSVKSVEEILERIEKVSMEDIKYVLNHCFLCEPSISILAPNAKDVLAEIEQEKNVRYHN